MMELKNKELFRAQNFVCGQWVDIEEQFISVVNPSTNEQVGRVPHISLDEVSKSIEFAKIAQKQWEKTTVKNRADILMNFHDLMIENIDDLATIMTNEQGKPLFEAKAEIMFSCSFIRWFAEEARRIYGDIIPAQSLIEELWSSSNL